MGRGWLPAFCCRWFAVSVSLLLSSSPAVAGAAGAAGGERWLLAPDIEADGRIAQNSSSPEADRLLQEGLQLFQQGTAESLRAALEKWEAARQLYRAAGDARKEAITLVGMGRINDDLGEKQKALEFYNQALPLRRAVGDRGGEAMTLNNIGYVYSSLGEKQKALEFYNQALPLRRAVGDRGGEAVTLNNIGLVYDDLGEKQKALEFYNQALPLLRAVGDRGGEAMTLNNIGSVYDSLGEKQKALEFFNQALFLIRAVGNRGGEAKIIGNFAYLKRSQGNLTEALTDIEAAIAIIEDLRTKIDSEKLRQSYFAQNQNAYEFYIDLLMELHRQTPNKGYDLKAFNASERARARTLLELLTEAKANIRQGIICNSASTPPPRARWSCSRENTQNSKQPQLNKNSITCCNS